MRRSTPILAVCLVLAASLAGWFLLQDRAEGPAPSDEGVAPADPAEEEAATLAARGPAAATVTASLDGRIRVSVQDAQRKPAGGVRVTVRRLGPAYDPNDPATWMGGGDANARALRTVADIDKPPPEAPPDATGTTDDAGACDVEVGRPGNYSVRAEPAAPRWGSSTTVTVTKDQLKPSAALRVGDGTPLRGRVVDARDRPVGAQLRGAWPLPDAQEGWSAPRIATDPATGAFAWEAVPSGEGSVQVTIPGRITISVRVVTPRTEELVIRLSPGGLVRGRVTDPAGAPVEGADVVVSVAALKGSEAVERGAVARAKTSADGTYRMEEVPPGQVGYVSTVAEGYRARTDMAAQAKWAPVEVAAGKETVLDVVLDRGSVIEGRVLAEGTGAPVPNAQVHALVTQSRWNDRPPPVMTDASGRFRFEGLAVGRYVLAATSATHYFDPFAANAAGVMQMDGVAQLQDAVVAVIGKDGERLERDIRMKSGLSVRGRVVAPDGTALEGAKVSCPQIQPWNAFYRWGVVQGGMPGSEATTAADGTFRLTGLPPGEAVTLSARKAPWTGPPPTPFKLGVGEPEPEIVLKMEPGCTVTGRVLDAQGGPVAGAQVQWWAQDQLRQGNGQAVSEPDGTFRLEGLPPTVVQVNSWASGKNASAEVSPALTTGEVRSGVDLRFVSGATISGVVVDAQGQPVKGIRLAASPVDGRGSFGMAVSREDGTFEMTNVAEMEYRVGVNPAPDEHSVAAPTEGPTVRAPATGVRIVAKARLETLVAGRVLRPDGTPVPLCSVRIGRGEPQQHYSGRGNTDEVVGGEFRRTVDAAPPFPLVVSGASGADGRRLNLREKRIMLDKVTTDLVITLEAGAVVAGRVVDARGAGIAGAQVFAGGRQASTDASGAFRFEGLDEGDVGLNVRPPAGYVPPAAVTVKSGTTDVVMTCASGVAIKGRVLGPDGEPLSQGGVQASWDGGNAWGQVGAGGAFKVEGLPVDAVVDLETNMWDPAGQMLRPARMEDVRAGTEDVVLRLQAGATVSGVVVDADGRPVAGRHVMAVGSKSRQAYSQQTDSQGRFTVGGLEPGPVTVTAMDVNASSPASPSIKTDAPATGIRLVLPRKATIRGRLVGENLAKFVVSAQPAESESSSGGTATVEVGADGRFTLEVWEGVPFTLTARGRDDDRYALKTPVAAGADVTLELTTGLSIDGTLRAADGKTQTQAWVWAKNPAWNAVAQVGADGTWRIRGLPPGSYRLETSLGKGVPETTVEAGASGVRLDAAR